MSIPTPGLVTTWHLSLPSARLGLQHGAQVAARHGWHLSIAIVDAAGELLAFEKHDGAAPVTPAVALAKARTAALLRAPSKLFEDFVNGGSPSFLATPGVTPLQGGVPVMLGDRVVGAVGVSGSSGEHDLATAEQVAGELQRVLAGAEQAA